MKKKEVGIREFKTRLSSYLREVKKGETLVVCDRGKPIAVVKPLPSGKRQLKYDVESKLREIFEKGLVILPEVLRTPSRPKNRKIIKGKPLSESVLEQRR